MSTPNSALAKVAAMKRKPAVKIASAKKAAPAPTKKAVAKKAAPKAAPAPRLVKKSDTDWAGIAADYNKGMSGTELYEKYKLKSGSKEEVSKYSRLSNVLTRLSHGVKLPDGKIIKIVRGKKKKKAA